MLLHHSRRLTAIILTIVLIVMLMGCTPKEERIKSHLLDALDQYEHLEHYRFTGSATLQLEPLLALSSIELDAVTASLLQSILHSQLSWEGTLDKTTSRWEMILGIEPADSDLSLQIPFILNQSSLYFHMPLLNRPDEFGRIELKDDFTVDLDEAGYAFQRILRHLTAAIDASSYSTKRIANSSGERIELELRQNNLDAWLNALHQAMPDIVAELAQAKLIHPSLLAQWQSILNDWDWKDLLDQIQITDSSGMTFTINEQDQIIGFQFSLAIKFAELAESIRIDLDYQLEDFDEKPSFTLELPQNIQPMDDLLNHFTSHPN